MYSVWEIEQALSARHHVNCHRQHFKFSVLSLLDIIWVVYFSFQTQASTDIYNRTQAFTGVQERTQKYIDTRRNMVASTGVHSCPRTYTGVRRRLKTYVDLHKRPAEAYRIVHRRTRTRPGVPTTSLSRRRPAHQLVFHNPEDDLRMSNLDTAKRRVNSPVY